MDADEKINNKKYIIELKKIEAQIERQELNTRKKLEEAYDTIDKKMKKLRYEFEQDTGADEKLVEHFKDDDPKDRFKSIMIAGTILGGIQLRNLWRENGKLDGEKEEIPYNEKQIKMIDKYNRLEETLDKLVYYAEYIFEDEEEFE